MEFLFSAYIVTVIIIVVVLIIKQARKSKIDKYNTNTRTNNSNNYPTPKKSPTKTNGYGNNGHYTLDELLEYVDDYNIKARFKSNAKKRGNKVCPICGEVLDVYSCKKRELLSMSRRIFVGTVEEWGGGRPMDTFEERMYLCGNCGHGWEDD